MQIYDISTFSPTISNLIIERADRVNFDTTTTPNEFPTEQEYYDATMIGIVSNEFNKHGLITSVSGRNGHGWFLTHT